MGPAPGRGPRRADRHRRRLLDGRRHRAARARSSSSAQRYDARVMVDDAHGTGAIGPGGRGAVAAAGLEDEVDVIVGTLGKALGSYGAYVLLRQADGEVPGQHRAHADLLDRAAAAGGGRRDGRARAAARAAAPGREAAAQRRACCARRWPSRVCRCRPVETPDRPARSSATPTPRWRACERALERGVFAQAIRPPTVPDGHLAAAAGGDGLAHEVRAARGAAAATLAARRCPRAEPRRRPPAAPARSGRRRPRSPSARPDPRLRGALFDGLADARLGRARRARPLRHRHRHRRRQVRRGRGDLRRAGRARRARRGVQAGRHGARRDPRRLAARPRAAGGRASSAGQAPERGRAVPLRPAASRRTTRPSSPGRRSSRRACSHARARPRAPTRWSCEGVGGLLVPLTPGYLGARPRRRARPAARDRGAAPGLGTINHTLLTVEAARAAGLDGAGVVLTPWPAEPEPIEARTARRSSALAGVPVSGLPPTERQRAGRRRAPRCRSTTGSRLASRRQ